MDKNEEKKNEKKAPFIITAPKQVISSAYLHINDFEEKPRFIVDDNGSKVFQKLNPPPEKPNVKAGYTEVLIRKVSYQDDPYERKECLERFEQLQNNVKIPCPFKCPRNHKIKEKEDLKEKTVEYGRKVIKRNISRLLSATKSKEQTEKLNKLMIKADTLFRSRKIVNNVKQQQQNVYGFDKGLFANVDKWKNMLNTLEKKEQEDLQKSKLSFQKEREEQKQQYILESQQKRKEKEVKELKVKEIKDQKEQKNKEIKEQIMQKELKYKEMQEQNAKKFRNYEQVQEKSKLPENPKIDLTPKNKTNFSHHFESTKKFKPATPSSFQKQQNQQDLKNQSFHSIPNTQEIIKQTSGEKSIQVQNQIIQKQKSTVQTPKSDTSKIKHTKQAQIEVNIVKSNQQSQEKDKIQKENSIIDKAKQNKSQRSNSQRQLSEERKSNYQSEERKIQDKDERSRYSEERKSNRSTSKVKIQENNQKIIMKPKNFTRAGSYKNPNIPKQENSQKTKVRAQSSGKRVQEEKPLNLSKITLPINHFQDKVDKSKEISFQKLDQHEQLINEIKIDQNLSSLNNFTEQHVIKDEDMSVNKNDKINDNLLIIKDDKINEELPQNKIDNLDENPHHDEIDKPKEDPHRNEIDKLKEDPHSNKIDSLKEDQQIIRNDKTNEDIQINKDIRVNEDLPMNKDNKINEDILINKTGKINEDFPINMDNKIYEDHHIIKIHKLDEDLLLNKSDKINEDEPINNIDKLNEDLPLNKIDKQDENLHINKIDKLDEVSSTIKLDKLNEETLTIKLDNINEDKLNTKNDKVIVPKEDDQKIEFVEQPVNEGLLNINDPHKNEKENEQKIPELEKQMSIMDNSIPVFSQHQKGISQFQSTNSLLIKQESNILKESLLTESLVVSQFKETKGLDKQLLSSQLNEQDSINLSESQATLKSTLQQSQLEQKQQ